MRLIQWLFILLLFSVSCHDAELPVVERDSVIKEKVLQSAIEQLLIDANHLLKLDPVDITQNYTGSRFGDKRTYVSLACYWWPDPGSADGLPYIRRDGEVNPETRTSVSDLTSLINMALRVETLTAAWKLTGDDQFARAATEQLYTWFVDHETMMLPHLEHAQKVRGRNSGRSYGVIDTWWLVRVVESAEHLQKWNRWSDELETSLKTWFSDYLDWLTESEFGQTEKQSKNNHGTWYDLQVVSFSTFTGQKEFAAGYIEKMLEKRIRQQITRSGRQKRELSRPRPVHYSIYNLNGLFTLAGYANSLNIELPKGRGLFSGDLEAAVRYLVHLANGEEPQKFIDPLDRTDTDLLYFRLLFDASAILNTGLWSDVACAQINEQLPDNHRLIVPLLFSGYDGNSFTHCLVPDL